MKKLVNVVKIGKQNQHWRYARIVYEGKNEADCKEWLFNHLKPGEHGYIEQVERRQNNG